MLGVRVWVWGVSGGGLRVYGLAVRVEGVGF